MKYRSRKEILNCPAWLDLAEWNSWTRAYPGSLNLSFDWDDCIVNICRNLSPEYQEILCQEAGSEI